jgi:sugar O-acyltransferase (sialic acid O-acetyltransferase NeuD family)
VADVVIYGTGSLGKLARAGIDSAGADVVVAFCVDAQHHSGAREFDGLPLVPFERLPESHPPDSAVMFVAIGYRRVNRGRAEVYARAKEMGYRLLTFVGPRAIVGANVEFGDNCFVFDGAIVEPSVRIGNDTVIWSGACIAHDVIVGNHCFLAPMASISGNVTLGDYVFVGNNATVRDGVAVAERTVVGAGALIKHDTRPGEIYSPQGAEAAPGRDSSELDDL